MIVAAAAFANFKSKTTLDFIRLLVCFRIRSSLPTPPRGMANFGFGTLEVAARGNVDSNRPSIRLGPAHGSLEQAFQHRHSVGGGCRPRARGMRDQRRPARQAARSGPYRRG